MTTNAEGPFCGGKRRGGEGGTCRRPAGWGTDHFGVGRCKLHGGSTPTHVKHGERAKLAEVVQTYGAPVVGRSNEEVLGDLIAAAFGHVTCLGAMIAASADLESIPAVVLQRYDVERALLGRMTRDALGANIAERQVKLAEDQGRRISEVMRDILADVFGALATAAGDGKLTVDVLVRIQREQVPTVVRQRLSEVMEVSQ